MTRKTGRTLARIAAGASLILAAGVAHAQYTGGLILDPARFKVADPIDYSFVPGFWLANAAVDDARLRYGLKLGYQFHPRFALVGKVSQFDARDGAALPPFESLAEHARGVRAAGIDLAGSLPILDRFAISGSAGVTRFTGLKPGDAVFSSVALPGLLVNPGLRAVSAGRVGLGVQYNFSRSLGLRFEVERYRYFHLAGDSDTDNFTFGMTYKF